MFIFHEAVFYAIFTEHKFKDGGAGMFLNELAPMPNFMRLIVVELDV